MNKICERQAKMAKYDGRFCPSTVNILERNKLASSNFFTTQVSQYKFEVECDGTSSVVNVQAKTCTYRMWELTGIPYKHAIAAIKDSRLQPDDFVDGCYTKT